MTRIAILDRADMNAEQARVYDAPSNPAASWAGLIMPISACRNCSRRAKTCGHLCHPDRCRSESNRL